MTRRPLIAVFLAASLATGGCSFWQSGLFHPATIDQQRRRATIHDPYADPDLGPKVDGGRPRDYLQPLPEPVRNRIYADGWQRR